MNTSALYDFEVEVKRREQHLESIFGSDSILKFKTAIFDYCYDVAQGLQESCRGEVFVNACRINQYSGMRYLEDKVFALCRRGILTPENLGNAKLSVFKILERVRVSY